MGAFWAEGWENQEQQPSVILRENICLLLPLLSIVASKTSHWFMFQSTSCCDVTTLFFFPVETVTFSSSCNKPAQKAEFSDPEVFLISSVCFYPPAPTQDATLSLGGLLPLPVVWVLGVQLGLLTSHPSVRAFRSVRCCCTPFDFYEYSG